MSANTQHLTRAHIPLEIWGGVINLLYFEGGNGRTLVNLMATSWFFFLVTAPIVWQECTLENLLRVVLPKACYTETSLGHYYRMVRQTSSFDLHPLYRSSQIMQ